MPARRVISFSEKALCMMFTLRPLPRVKVSRKLAAIDRCVRMKNPTT